MVIDARFAHKTQFGVNQFLIANNAKEDKYLQIIFVNAQLIPFGMELFVFNA
jgi:hypothetical protein